MDFVINLETLLDHFCKAVNFVDCLAVPLLLLLDDLEGSVLFTKDAETAFSLYLVHFHEVVGPPRTLNVERDHALRVLALDAGARVLQAADNALQAEALAVELVQTHGSFGRHLGPWNPHRARQVHPLVQGFCGHGGLQVLLVPLQEKLIVFWLFANCF